MLERLGLILGCLSALQAELGLGRVLVLTLGTLHTALSQRIGAGTVG